MDLYLIRHAIAVEPGDARYDHARPLTPKGRVRFQRAVDGLDAIGVTFSCVYHSPMVRARQTAELLAPLADSSKELDALGCAPTPALLTALEGDRVALVGHEPWLSALLSLLLVGNTSAAGTFRFRKGGVAQLTGMPAPKGCILQMFLPPRALRRLR